MDEARTPLTGRIGARARGAMTAARDAVARKTLRTHCPARPGVYVMRDDAGSVIYVGKSRSLRNRLAHYLRAGDSGDKAWRIIQTARHITWEEWPDEFGCMLREIELIQALKPRYNVQYNPLRKKRGYLCLTTGEAPRFHVAVDRPERADVLVAVGPLPSRRRLAVVCKLLNDHYRLADCDPAPPLAFDVPRDPEARPGCLRVLVKRCLGPCVGGCARAAYDEQVEVARRFILGKDLSVVRAAQAGMAEAAEALQFEDAAHRRDEWLLLRWVARRMRDLRRARRGFDFVYRVPRAEGGGATWYVMRGGLVVAVADEAHDHDGKVDLARLIGGIYAGPRRRTDFPDALAGENLYLVTRWFRLFPEEKKRLMTPEQALAQLTVSIT